MRPPLESQPIKLTLEDLSYDDTSRLIAEVDNTFISQSLDDLKFQRFVDVGSGTGRTIKHLFETGRVSHPFRVIGMDIDSAALKKAGENLTEEGKLSGQINLREGNAEEVWEDTPGRQIPDFSQELVTCFNMIHLLNDPLHIFEEAHRVLSQKGILLVNSAYVEGSYPNAQVARFWGTIVALARRRLASDFEIGRPKNYMRLSPENYKRLAQEADFTNIEVGIFEKQMTDKEVKALCKYDKFAEGSLPGVPPEIGGPVLFEVADEAFNRFGDIFKDGVPRRWMFLRAQK